MAVTAKITGVNYHVNGTTYVSFASGEMTEYATPEDLQSVAVLADDPGEGQLAQKLLLGHWHALNPAMDNSGLIIGKLLTLDMTQAAPLTVVDD